MGKRQFFSYPLVFLAVFVLSLTLFATSVQAADFRAQKLANFFASQASPLVDYAPDFVYFADQNGLDYRLLPAISGVESTFGKNYIEGTYNAYGWGQGTIPFTSWRDGISKISNSIRTNYINKGAVTIEQIGSIYCPPNYSRWSANVRQFMNQIDSNMISFQTISFSSTFPVLPLTI